ncbi:hypothetical protein V8C86DRAFT_3139393, partial [Haematococcus lacustris]
MTKRKAAATANPARKRLTRGLLGAYTTYCSSDDSDYRPEDEEGGETLADASTPLDEDDVPLGSRIQKLRPAQCPAQERQQDKPLTRGPGGRVGRRHVGSQRTGQGMRRAGRTSGPSPLAASQAGAAAGRPAGRPAAAAAAAAAEAAVAGKGIATPAAARMSAAGAAVGVGAGTRATPGSSELLTVNRGHLLPPDVLRCLMARACEESALPTAAAVHMVCRAWRDVAASMPELWARLHITPASHTHCSDAVVARAVEAGRWSNVTELVFAETPPRLTARSLLMLAQACPLLTSLDLSGCRSLKADAGLIEVAVSSITHLQHLDLSGCLIQPRGTGLERVIRAALTPRLGQVSCCLVSLRVRACAWLTRTSLAALAQCPQPCRDQAQPVEESG